MTPPFVSIALCTYNGEKYLVQQLDSIIHQSYQNIEIVAVDDCSSDRTLTILQQYATIDSRIKVHQNERNLGYSKNFEHALTLCTGEYIAISDQDDIWVPEKIELLMGLLGNRVLVYSNSALVDRENKPLGRTWLDRFIPYEGADLRVMAACTFMLGHSMLFKRSLLEQVIPIPKGVSYDVWLGSMALNCGGVSLCNKSLTLFRRHDNNTSTAIRLTKRESLLSVLNYYEALLAVPNIQHRLFYECLHKHLKRRMRCWVYPGLPLFLFRNREILTLVLNKSKLSKLNHLRNIWI